MQQGATALVTGAGGFIASHLVEALVESGWRVRGMLRYGSAGDLGCLADLSDNARRFVELRRGDLLDAGFVAECCRGIDTVFHLGARISIPYSYAAPRDTIQVNCLGTLNVLEAVRQAGVRRLVHASSSEVFGSAVAVPMDEHHRLKGQSPYAASKIAADKIVESYHCAFSIPTVTVRPFNTYGPRQSPRAVISRIIQQVMDADHIAGPVRLGSLWPRRDFTFVSDTVAGFLRAAEAEDAVGQEINLGSGADISIGELARTILEVTGCDREVISEEPLERPAGSEVSRLLADNRKAARVLGWAPSVSLTEGLGRTVAWWRCRPGRFAWAGDAT
jgi:nucleoside-diphosphate-sugar epimerase